MRQRERDLDYYMDFEISLLKRKEKMWDREQAREQRRRDRANRKEREDRDIENLNLFPWNGKTGLKQDRQGGQKEK